MVDWKDIHPDFTEELQKEWENKGFCYEECKEWVDAGLKFADADYAKWLRDIKQSDANWVLNHSNDKELRQEYDNYLENEINIRQSDDEMTDTEEETTDNEEINAQEWLDKIPPGGKKNN